MSTIFKICRCCGVEQPLEAFRFVKLTGKWRRECRGCERLIARQTRKKIAADPELSRRHYTQQAEWRLRNLDRVRKYQREYHRAYRKTIRDRRSRDPNSHG